MTLRAEVEDVTFARFVAQSLTTRNLLIATALIELGAGLALLCVPGTAVQLLAGVSLDNLAATSLIRVAGAALIALGGACWMVGDETKTRAAKGLLAAMMFYNVATAAILAHAGIGLHLQGILLWPGVALHTTMAVWCTRRFRCHL